jgi:hypothetical protein
MPHAIALYTVQIGEVWHDAAEFGDIDGAGVYLGDVLVAALNGLQMEDEEQDKVATCQDVKLEGEDVLVTLVHGQSGRAGDIVDKDGQDRYRLTLTDTTRVRCGVLFRLPRDQKRGWALFHLNDGHGTKSLVEQGLRAYIGPRFEELRLKLSPFVPDGALSEAAEKHLINKVRLQRWVTPSDSADTQKWIPDGYAGKIELSISVRERSRRLTSDLIARFAKGDQSALDSIVEFDGMKFDKVRVEAVIDGRRRTFYLERPASGHPMTEDITQEVKAADDGQPNMDTVFAALRARIPSDK